MKLKSEIDNKFLFYNFCPSICSHILDFKKEEYLKWGINPKHNYPKFIPNKVNYGDKIYVKPDLLNIFFKEYYPRISNKFILITSGAGLDITSKFERVLYQNKIIKWYGTNILFEHEKIHKIPIGFEENERSINGPASGEGGDQQLLQELYNKKLNFCDKKNKILVTYLSKTHSSRSNLNEKLNKDFFEKIGKKSFNDYMEKINEYKFVLSPRGCGTDTHRFWEISLMGSVPIIETSGLDDLYKNFPCIIVNDFNDLNQEIIDNFKYDEEKSKNIEKYLLIENFVKIF